MTIKLYNTLTRKKEDFVPLHAGKVGMYVCGPTVYNYLQIGNWKAYIFSDTLRRMLEDAGFEVRMIENITDVGHLTADDVGQADSGEDKIARKARAEKKTPQEVALFYEGDFHEGEKKLNILSAHFYPRATQHVPHMIQMIKTLIAQGHAYEVNGNVFYDVKSFANYGRLSGNTLEQLKVGARLEEHPDKKNPWDFALWLRAPKEHLMKWSSPWGEGYPGWHIECSAMSTEYLGASFDIHTGGEDHIFPHHEAEIAQSEGSTGQPYVRFFLHERHILIDNEKMSKSKGNSYLLQDIEKKGFSSMDLRIIFLSSHYRSQMNFTWEALDQAKKNRESVINAYERLKILPESKQGFDGKTDLDRIRTALRDDLNTPLALAEVLELANKINALLDKGEAVNTQTLKKFFETIFFLFGLKIEAGEIPDGILKLAQARRKARQDKDFAEADRLRQKIEEAGYRVEDIGSEFRLKKG